MKQLIIKFLDKLFLKKNLAQQKSRGDKYENLAIDYAQQIRDLNSQVRGLTKKLTEQKGQVDKLHLMVKQQGAFPAGHFYSPIPDQEDVHKFFESFDSKKVMLPEIDINKEGQLQVFQDVVQFYNKCPFPEKQTDGYRYYYDQDWFCYGDALMLYSFLRKNIPNRIIEVGSGYSSAVMLDTIDHFLSQNQIEISFIEPFPNRLMSLLNDSDKKRYNIIDAKVQELPLDTFKSLHSGDLLFIDSSHVLKCGSDLQYLMFEVLPILPEGVFVHFHDIFYPFEYPSDWLKDGRYWNEGYLLRAFLSYNREWSIYMFNSYLAGVHKDAISQNIPLFLKNPGGSLYLQKVHSKDGKGFSPAA